MGRVLISARSFEEYCANFSLVPADLLGGAVLDCPGGASDFGAAVRRAGGRAVSVDPQYGLPHQELAELVVEELERARRWADQQPTRFRSGHPAWRREEAWERSADTFLRDFGRDRTARTGHYVAAALPRLPFADGAFRLVLSGFFLFTYADRTDRLFHLRAVTELLRVCSGEVRLHPLNEIDGKPYRHLDWLLQELRTRSVAVREERVRSHIDAQDDRTLVLNAR
ncbi:hypothetical protein [Streptomyces sp. NPDC091215]|uniref:hypothetical protein n=1 Tax=Streptomyces sp. NPDC091215 TaxID=3155192 RepID=UPI0034389301